MSSKPHESDLLQKLLFDARSYARPYVRRVRGVARAYFNDANRLFQTERHLEEPLRQQWWRVLRRSRDVINQLTEPGSPRIFFASGHGWGDARLTFETILAMAVRLRGATPFMFYCDKTLPACEFNRFGNFELNPGVFGSSLTERSKQERCRICTENLLDPYDLLPVTRASYREFLKADDLSRISKKVDALPYDAYGDYCYRDVQVGEQAFASVMRATLRGTLLKDAETHWLFRRYLIASMLMVDLTERAFERIKPERLVAIHGIYVTHGTICETARKHRIPVVVYGTPYRKDTVWLSHHDTYHRTLITEPTANWENIMLTPRMAQRVDDYLASKRLGGRDYAAYHADAVNDREALMQELKLKPRLPIISLFTNVLWDAQLYYRYNAFGNMLEWLFETIRYFAKRSDLQLVIRIHPAETKSAMPTNQPLLPEILREFPTLPENIKVISPESKLSSYTLAEMSQAALIYGARMGVEIAVLGIPLIVAGETFNRRKGYSYDVKTREEYRALLERIHELPRNSPEMIERARKYAYHYYFRLMIEFPLFSVKEGIHLSDPQLEFEHLRELLPGSCGALDLICQGIMDATTPFIYDSLLQLG